MRKSVFRAIPLCLTLWTAVACAYEYADAQVEPSPVPKDTTVVHVEATMPLQTVGTVSSPFVATAADILASAGTYGDFTRYLQSFPGVVFNDDVSDDLIVRGGNPIENLFLVDGIEIPNINHISTIASTGGLVSMVDTSLLQTVNLLAGGYDARYDERLSSVVDIHTRELDGDKLKGDLDVGIVGAGGLLDYPLSHGGSVLLSAHRSLLNFFTNNIGIDGVPIYTNMFGRARINMTPNDSLNLLSISGVDSLNINPCSGDFFETNTINTQYTGWRTTNGMQWLHSYSGFTSGTATLSDSEQNQSIGQQDQQLSNQYSTFNAYSCSVVGSQTVYSENTHDGMTTAQYDLRSEWRSKISLDVGGFARLYRVNYAITQPVGQQSSFSTDPKRSDATSFYPEFSTGETSGYFEATVHLNSRWNIGAGERFQTIALGGYTTATSRANTIYRLAKSTSLYFSFGQYAQMPPTPYIVSYPVNRQLLPIRASHVVVGSDIFKNTHLTLGAEAYNKEYRNYPVSTEYPTLSLANMVDTLGQQFVWIPFTSLGRGHTYGAELYGSGNITSHFTGQANISYARALYSGLDKVLRPGNFDYPIIFNADGIWRSGRKYEASFRYEHTSGRPYTPFAMTPSLQQDRPIYDLHKVNAMRGPAYSRLDFQVDRNFAIKGGIFTLYAGLLNAFNSDNFLGYAWMPHCDLPGSCGFSNGPYTALYEMPIFPNLGVRYNF